MTIVKLHGKLAEEFGENWKLEVKSVSEVLRAIEANTGKFRKFILENQYEFNYEVMINHKSMSYNGGPITLENYAQSDLYVEFGDELKTVDIIPIIVGSKTALTWIGAGAMFVGAFIFPPAAPFLIAGGLALAAAGVTMMLSKPPPLIPYQDQQATVNKQSAIGGGGGGVISYLFNGPTNTVGEGGPVQVGYGELLVGSHNISTNYDIIYSANYRDISTGNLLETSKGFQYLFNEHAMLINQSSVTSNF